MSQMIYLYGIVLGLQAIMVRRDDCTIAYRVPLGD